MAIGQAPSCHKLPAFLYFILAAFFGRRSSATFSDNRRVGWTYGADGQETHSTGIGIVRDHTYNCAGQMVQLKETVTATSQVSTYVTSYDGDGNLIKEVVQETNATSYKVRSSVLGEIVTGLNSAGNKTGTTVHLDKRVTPTRINSTDTGNVPFPIYEDPLRQSIAGDRKAVYDPLGNHILWQSSPQSNPPPFYPRSSASFGSLGSSFGNAQESTCELDGIPTNCDVAMQNKNIAKVTVISNMGARGIALELGLTLTKEFYWDGPELSEGLFWRFFHNSRNTRNFNHAKEL